MADNYQHEKYRAEFRANRSLGRPELYNTFISELEYINKGKNKEVIDERSLSRVHQAISTGLVSDYVNPLERAVYLHCNIAKLQPFIDGNKRTSRMVESITLMNADIIPAYSSKDADIPNYRNWT